MDNVNSAYLMHHGIKGMKWGVRRFEDANGHLTEAGKRRYAIQDARKYYKINRLQRAKEHTKNTDKSARLSKRLRKVKTRSDRKHSDLNQKDINAGREIVAKNRLKWAGFNTAAKAALTAAGAAYLYQNPNTRALAPLALAGGAALTAQSAKKVPYYFMENRRYKQVNEKGATTKGLTERQKKLRKVGKTALAVGLGAAAIGGGAYAATKYRNAKLTRNTINNASSATKEILKANRKASFSRARKNVANKAKSSKFSVNSSISFSKSRNGRSTPLDGCSAHSETPLPSPCVMIFRILRSLQIRSSTILRKTGQRPLRRCRMTTTSRFRISRPISMPLRRLRV